MQRRFVVMCAVIASVLVVPAAARANWLAPTTVSGATPATGAAVATNARGDALAVWIAAGALQASSSTAGGPWSAPVAVTDPATDGPAATPVVALRADGGAYVVYQRTDAGTSIRAVRRQEDGTWDPSQQLSAGAGSDPDIAINASDYAAAVWTDGTTIEGRIRLNGDEGWRSRQAVSTTAALTASRPAVTVGPDDTVTAVWRQRDTTTGVIQSADRQSDFIAGNLTWDTPVDVSDTSRNATTPDVGIDGNGTTTLVYTQSDGTRNTIRTAARPQGGAWEASSLLSPAGETSGSPRVAVNARGDAVAAWLNTPNLLYLRAATKPAGGAWTAPAQPAGVSLSAAPRAAIDAEGKATALWNQGGGAIGDFFAASATAGSAWSTAQRVSPGALQGDNVYPWDVAAAGRRTVAGFVEYVGGTAQARVADNDLYPPRLDQVTVPASGRTRTATGFSTAASDDLQRPITYAWTFGDDTPAVAGAAVAHTYLDPGERTVTVTATDAAGNQASATRTISVTGPGRCLTSYEYGVTRFTTTGCFATDGKRYTTTDPVRMNGLTLSGSQITITLPTAAGDLPRVQSSNLKIAVGALTAYQGAVDWRLPKTDATSKTLQTGQVGPSLRLLGQTVRGVVSLTPARSAAGSYSTEIAANLELPSAFRTAPWAGSAVVTSPVKLQVDDAGTMDARGLRLTASDVYLGSVKVDQVCVAYLPAGGTGGTPCAAPQVAGRPGGVPASCSQDTGTDRWSGSAVLTLPTKSNTRLGVYGGLSGGQLASLGGFADNLGKSVSLAPDVFLDSVAVGVCVTPPPVKVSGSANVSVLPVGSRKTIEVGGSFLFTSADGAQPWSLSLTGDVRIFGLLLGQGALAVNGNGSIDFSVSASLRLLSVVSISGRLVGWVETSNRRFNVEGSGSICLGFCLGADAIASSTGFGGCGSAVVFVYWTLEKNSDFHWYTPWRVHWERHDVRVRAGFGYKWESSSVSILGNSCDFGPYRAQRSAVISQSGARAIDVASGTPMLALRISGAGAAAPRVVVTGPKGERIALPAGESGVRLDDGSAMALNASDGTTAVLLAQPGAGRWTITPEPGSAAVTEVETSGYEPQAEVSATVHRLASGERRLASSYTLPEGATLSLVEEGNDVQQTILERVKGEDCPAPKSPDGRVPQCNTVDFAPATGPGGTRRIVAIVSRDGTPLSRQVVAHYTAPRLELPAQPHGLRIQRYSKHVVIRWDRSPGVSTYAMTTQLGTGEQQGHELRSSCRALSVRVPKRVSVRATLAGVRYDLRAGKRSARSLEARAARTGVSTLPKTFRFKGKVCR